MSWITDFFANNPWSVYLIAMIGPFVQEDTAVIGAASSAAAGTGEPALLLLATWAGLVVSDGWKYWAGRLAYKLPWAAKFTADPRVMAAHDKVVKRIGIALIVARFVPGTRIPLNVACGLFRVSFLKFILLIMLSAALYLGLAFAVFSTLGAIVGEQVRSAIPFVVVPLVLVIVAVAWTRKPKQSPSV
ncbi:MAG: VTT domain-containing protein [Hyphomonadaceae bacterium]|nr:VTT domain-containing protein [Hyphomonadaceae bacterium]